MKPIQVYLAVACVCSLLLEPATGAQATLDCDPFDGICGNSDGSETLRAWGIAPAVFELFGPYEFLKERGWWFGGDKENRKGYGHKLEDCVEIGKPSYLDLSRGGRSGLGLLNAESELVHRLANRMGYHFVLKEKLDMQSFIKENSED